MLQHSGLVGSALTRSSSESSRLTRPPAPAAPRRLSPPPPQSVSSVSRGVEREPSSSGQEKTVSDRKVAVAFPRRGSSRWAGIMKGPVGLVERDPLEVDIKLAEIISDALVDSSGAAEASGRAAGARSRCVTDVAFRSPPPTLRWC